MQVIAQCTALPAARAAPVFGFLRSACFSGPSGALLRQLWNKGECRAGRKQEAGAPRPLVPFPAHRVCSLHAYRAQCTAALHRRTPASPVWHAGLLQDGAQLFESYGRFHFCFVPLCKVRTTRAHHSGPTAVWLQSSTGGLAAESGGGRLACSAWWSGHLRGSEPSER